MISTQLAHEWDNVVSPTHRPPSPPGNISGAHFCYKLSRPQGPSAVGRIRSMKNPQNPNGYRTRDIPACSAVPQPPAPYDMFSLCPVKLFCTLTLENNCPFAVSASALVLCWWIGQMQGGVENPGCFNCNGTSLELTAI